MQRSPVEHGSFVARADPVEDRERFLQRCERVAPAADVEKRSAQRTRARFVDSVAGPESGSDRLTRPATGRAAPFWTTAAPPIEAPIRKTRFAPSLCARVTAAARSRPTGSSSPSSFSSASSPHRTRLEPSSPPTAGFSRAGERYEALRNGSRFNSIYPQHVLQHGITRAHATLAWIDETTAAIETDAAAPQRL